MCYTITAGERRLTVCVTQHALEGIAHTVSYTIRPVEMDPLYVLYNTCGETAHSICYTTRS